ncbi:MAG: T9SS type A sorting domain-containing protein [Bacteroidales bacterium]
MKTIIKITLLFLVFCFFCDKKKNTDVEIHAVLAAPASELQDFDQPMEAAAFEFERTKDPALGYVPRERLYKASEYTKTLKSSHTAIQLLGATYNMTWTERGPNNWGGRTRAIMVDPNDATKKTIWAGGVDGGLWKTTDITVANPVWTQVNDFFSNLAVTAIAFNPANMQVMYFGTGEGWYNADAVQGDGIWKSTDGGNSWSQLPSTTGNTFWFVNKIAVDASGNVYAATRGQYCNTCGIFKSTDGGTSWTLVLYDATCTTSYYGADIEIAADGTLYASLGIFNQGSVYKSATGNSGTWTKLNTGGASGFPTTGFYRVELACAPSNANTVYALTQSSSTYGIYNIYKTTNAGTSWTTITLPTNNTSCDNSEFTNGQAWYDLIAAVDPNSSTTLFVGGLNIFKSTNAGSSWTQISQWYGGCSFQYVHSDQHAIVFQPGSSDVIYFGNDGGIYRAANGTAGVPTITAKNSSYNITQFYSVAIHPTMTNYFLAGAQDNGSHQFTTAGINSTTQVTGGDGAFCQIDQNNANYQFTSYVYSNYYVSANSGSSWTGYSWGNHGQFINPTDYDNTQFKLYCGWDAGYYFFWDNPRTGNTGYTVSVGTFNSGKVTAVTVSPNTAARVFFGLANGRVVRVDNAATSPVATLIGTPVAGASVSCICVEQGNDNHIIITYSNYGVTSVWETTNGGTSWTSVEGNLPDMPVRWAVFNPYTNTQLFLATELGVWIATLNGASTTWVPINTGLANVRVDMIKVRNSDKLIAVATHGRGLFTSTVPSNLPIELLSFNTVCEGNNVSLNWSTASETNNDFFIVERSKDAQTWEIVTTTPGAGNSNSTLYYSATDIQPYPDYTYYRLKQTDYNGAFTYSNVVVAGCGTRTPFNLVSIYQNQQGNIVLSFTADEGEQYIYILYDIRGRMLQNKSAQAVAGINEVHINTQGMSEGIYIVTLQNATKLISKKVFINNQY